MQVQQFYRGSKIFLTGGSGFIGKAIVEKLLRSCPEIDRIYLLLRGHNGVDSHSRWKEIQRCPIFDTIRYKDVMSKVIVLNGEFDKPNLGLSDSNREKINEADIVIHNAALTAFNPGLYSSLKSNTLGTKKVLDISLGMKNLKSFVYVSTCYCNISKSDFTLKEEVYPLPIAATEILNNMEDSKYLKQVESKLLPKHYYNSYVFSKSVAENVVKSYKNQLPIVIFRPSLVTSVWKEPLPGWTDDNTSMTTHVAKGAATGALRYYNCIPDLKIDLIPLDICTNSLVVSACHGQQLRKVGIKLPVYNCASGDINPLTWKEKAEIFRHFWRENPSKFTMMYPGMSPTTNNFLIWSSHLTALGTQILNMLLGKPAKQLTYNIKMKKILNLSESVCKVNYQIKSDNQKRLSSSLSPEEAKIFPTDVSKLKWKEYLISHSKGLKKYILEDLDTVHDSKKKELKMIVKGGQVIVTALILLPLAVCLNVFI